MTARSLHVVGIGASAGGLDALLLLLGPLRANGRMAYVVAQHMAHDAHGDLMVRLLARETSLPVISAISTQTLVADTIYLIPAGSDGVVVDGQLRLQHPRVDSLSTPSVNILFDSLAQQYGRRAIGVVLSGTGSDGQRGCRLIRDRDGRTFAQDPTEARFDGMPTAVIGSRAIEQVLPAARIGELLASFFDAPTTLGEKPPWAEANSLPTTNGPSDELKAILEIVRCETGIDFSCYKEETLLRRLQKRQEILGKLRVAEYLAHLRRHPEEAGILQNQFLVSVSAFFRDRQSFLQLEQALNLRLQQKPPGEPVRVWVPGCASGEEAYSLAILIRELLTHNDQRRPVDIVGTDLNLDALKKARLGIYRDQALREMNRDHISLYFTRDRQHFAILPVIREGVRFIHGDVFDGPPLTNLDLVSCRNLLIYMKSVLQDRLVTTIHSALDRDGLFFIGQSESLGFSTSPLFSAIDNYHRLYRRRSLAS